VEPVSVTAVGDELVVVQARDTLTVEDQQHTLDVVVVWRIVDGLVREVWDIVPSGGAR
jgi:predicted SnoaL-like aldol condensation-catalyzing enzyme